MFALAAATGCYQASSYTGDGSLVDRGWRSYSLRYVIDLGAIDLSQRRTYTYTLANLPDAQFTIGIEARGSQAEQHARVRIELKSETGETIVLEDAPLKAWTWSHGFEDWDGIRFGYRSGESVDVRISENHVRHTPIGVKASGGWGSYFNSEQAKSYALRLEIVEPGQSNRTARLKLHGR